MDLTDEKPTGKFIKNFAEAKRVKERDACQRAGPKRGGRRGATSSIAPESLPTLPVLLSQKENAINALNY